MNKSLRARHEQLKGDIGEAARLRDEAARKFQAQEQRVAELEKEIAALRASLRRMPSASRRACSRVRKNAPSGFKKRCGSSSISR